MSWFESKDLVKGVELLVTNYLDWDEVRKVYNTGHGPFIYAWSGDVPRYLASDGTFQNPKYRTCNGDPVSWKIHRGLLQNLELKQG